MVNKYLDHIRIGQDAPVQVEIFNVSTDAVIDLTGYTALSAVANDPVSGASVAITAALTATPTDGKIDLSFTVAAFTVPGVYDITITGTDGNSDVQKFPKESGTYKWSVGI